MPTIRSIASFVPTKWRALVYSIAGLLNFLVITWSVIPEQYDGKVIGTVNFILFGVAAVNATPAKLPPPPPPAGE